MSEFPCVQRGNQRARSSLSARPLPEEVQPSTLPHTLHTVGSVAEAHCVEHCLVQHHFTICGPLKGFLAPFHPQKKCTRILLTAEMAQSVQRLATGWTVRGSNPEEEGGAIFRLVQTGPEAHPASCTMGTGSYRG